MADEQQAVLVIASKVKAYVAEKKLRTSGDVAEVLTAMVIKALDIGIERAKEDKRQTLKGRDLDIAMIDAKAVAAE